MLATAASASLTNGDTCVCVRARARVCVRERERECYLCVRVRVSEVGMSREFAGGYRYRILKKGRTSREGLGLGFSVKILGFRV